MVRLFFKVFAFKRVPTLSFYRIPREEWNAERVAQIKDVIAVYKRYRHLMDRPTVMKGYKGVKWENATDTKLYFSFEVQSLPFAGTYTEALTGKSVSEGLLQPFTVYVIG
jgi:hypothetical protein